MRPERLLALLPVSSPPPLPVALIHRFFFPPFLEHKHEVREERKKGRGSRIPATSATPRSGEQDCRREGKPTPTHTHSGRRKQKRRIQSARVEGEGRKNLIRRTAHSLTHTHRRTRRSLDILLLIMINALLLQSSRLAAPVLRVSAKERRVTVGYRTGREENNNNNNKK